MVNCFMNYSVKYAGLGFCMISPPKVTRFHQDCSVDISNLDTKVKRTRPKPGNHTHIAIKTQASFLELAKENSKSLRNQPLIA